jgi:sec-independent protein translocase protein TatC
MPFLEHLEELRKRLFYCAAAFAVALAIVGALYYFSKFDAIEFLQRPIQPYMGGRKLVYTHPGTSFRILIDSAVVAAFVLASPIIGYQLWRFVSPAMYKHERRRVLPILSFGIVLFVCGVALAFTLILPLTLKFLLSIESDALTSMITIDAYAEFAIYMCVAFGAAFELPIVIMGLTWMGIAKPEFLAKYRRFAIVGGLIAGGFITPDPSAMFLIAVPLYGLYEISILLSRRVYKVRLRRDAAYEEEETTSPSTAAAVHPPVGGAVERPEPRRLTDTM